MSTVQTLKTAMAAATARIQEIDAELVKLSAEKADILSLLNLMNPPAPAAPEAPPPELPAPTITQSRTLEILEYLKSHREGADLGDIRGISPARREQGVTDKIILTKLMGQGLVRRSPTGVYTAVAVVDPVPVVTTPPTPVEPKYPPGVNPVLLNYIRRSPATTEWTSKKVGQWLSSTYGYAPSTAVVKAKGSILRLHKNGFLTKVKKGVYKVTPP